MAGDLLGFPSVPVTMKGVLVIFRGGKSRSFSERCPFHDQGMSKPVRYKKF